MKTNLTITYRDTLIPLEVDVDYTTNGDRIMLMSVSHNGAELLGVLDQVQRDMLRARAHLEEDRKHGRDMKRAAAWYRGQVEGVA